MDAGSAADMPELHQRLSPHVQLVEEPSGTLRFDAGKRGSVTITPQTAVMADALRAIANGLAESAQAALEKLPDFDAITFEYYVLQLRKLCMLEMDLRGRDDDLLTIVTHRLDFALAAARPVTADGRRLCRFAYIHMTERGMVLDSPEASCSVCLHDPRTLVWLHDLAKGPVLQDGHDPDRDERAAVVTVLDRCGFLDDVSQPESPARASWEFHDRLFHSASRPDNVPRQVGGSYRFKDRFPSPPVLKPRMDGERIELDTPDMARVAQQSGSLLDVMERRRSFRHMGDPPITLPELSTFLYRVARFVDVLDDMIQPLAMRVFPSGGAIHELEFYLSVRVCEGLAPGFYHYHAFDHALDGLPNAAGEANAIIRRAGEDWSQPDDPPQVVVTLASRLPRIAWKYDTVAYRATLMNTGVAVQTMCLVAEDMNLGCAPAGRGSPAVFAAATGLDPFEETSVLEFGLGTREAGVKPTIDRVADTLGRRRNSSA